MWVQPKNLLICENQPIHINSLKKENPNYDLSKYRKAFDKIQQPFLISLRKLSNSKETSSN